MDGDGTNQSALNASVTHPQPTANDPRPYRPSQPAANFPPILQHATVPPGQSSNSTVSVEQSTRQVARDDASSYGTGPVTPGPFPNSTGYDLSHIVPDLFQFNQASCSLHSKKLEKKTLEAELAWELKNQERAKSVWSQHPSMSSLISTVPQIIDRLSILDAEIEREEIACQELMGSLQKTLRLPPPSFWSDTVAKIEAGFGEKLKAESDAQEDRITKKMQDEMKKMQDEMKKMQTDMKKAQTEMRKAQAETKKMQAETKKTPEEKEAILNGTSNASGENDTSDLRERVEKMDEELKKVRETVEYQSGTHKGIRKQVFDLQLWQAKMEDPESQANQVAGKAAKERVEEAMRKMEVIEKEFTKIRNEVEDFKFNAFIRRPPPDANGPSNPPSDLGAGLSKLESHQTTWESLDVQTKTNANAIHHLQSQQRHILDDQRNQVARLSHLEANYTNLGSAFSTLSRQLPEEYVRLTQMAQSIRTDHDNLSRTVNLLNENVWRKLHELESKANSFATSTSLVFQKHFQDIQSVANRVPSCENSLDSVQVAIRSLENRYSNISTENLFKNIVQELNETFPSLGNHQQDIQAVKEKLTSLADQYMTRADFGKEISQLKDTLHVLRAATNDANSQVVSDAVKRVEEISEQMSRTQKGQSEDLVKIIEDHSDLLNRFETLSGSFEDLAEKVSDVAAQLSEETKGSGQKLEESERQLADIRKQLLDLKASCSPETVKMICEQSETRISAKMKDMVSTEMVSKQYPSVINRDPATPRDRAPSQLPTNGSRSRPDGDNGIASSPQVVQRNPRDLPDVSSASSSAASTSPPASTPDRDSPPTEAPRAPRAMSKPIPSATAPEPSDQSLQIRGKASQKETANRLFIGAQDQSLGSRVVPNRPPPVKVSGPPSVRVPGPPTVRDTRPPSPSRFPPKSAANQAPYKHGKPKGTKRRLDDRDRDDIPPHTAPRKGSDYSPAPSSSHSSSRKKKKSKKDKRPTSHLG